MPMVSILAICVMLAQGSWILSLWWSARRATARTVQRRPGMLAVALLLVAVNITLAALAALSDAQGHDIRVAWLVMMPAALAITGVAHGLTVLATQKDARGRSAEAFAWVLLLAAFGVGACYGSVFLGAMR